MKWRFLPHWRPGPRASKADWTPQAAFAISRDFLDALVALGFLEREDCHYRNTPSTDLYLDKRKPSYIGGMLEMANSASMVTGIASPLP